MNGMNEMPRYWYGEKNWFGQRLALNWQGWVADVVWWLAVPLAAKFFMNPNEYPLLCTGLFFGWIFVGLQVREWKGEP
jgi:hypothetical protein